MAEGPSQVGVGVARAGLAGNPSDALGGAAIAIAVPALAARVELHDADRIVVRGPAEEQSWATMADLDERTARFGHEGGDRLVTAALAVLWRWASPSPHLGTPFAVAWSTAIPRSVGLAGSSALIVATLRAAADRWELSIDAPTLAWLTLETERSELGLPAGWMDRAVQAHGGPTWMDARSTVRVGDLDLPVMEPVVPAPIDVVIAWDPVGAAPSRRLHGGLQARRDAADPALLSAVDRLVEVAITARDALCAGDRPALLEAVDASCELRRELGALDARTSALVDIARRAGGAATSAGSGGAISVVTPEGGLAAVTDAFSRAGHPTVIVPLP